MMWQLSFPEKQNLRWKLVYRTLLGSTVRINSVEDMKEERLDGDKLGSNKGNKDNSRSLH